MRDDMQMNENRRRLAGELYEYIHGVVDTAIQNNWKIIIWGLGNAGIFLRYLICDFDGRLRAEYIIDEKLVLTPDSEGSICRSTLLEYLNSQDYMILSTIKNIEEIQEKLFGYGYELGRNLFDVYGEIGESYIDFLRKKYGSIEFGNVWKDEMEKDFGEECNEHSPFGRFCVDKVFDEINELNDNIRFFDFGAGKGAALILAYMAGITELGGVEIESGIYRQACHNLKILGIDCNLLNRDARECEIDDYNCFFFYNPFTGQIFKDVIRNIQESYIKNRRKIYIVYGNPFCHGSVVEDGYFELYKQVRTNLYDPLLNIYKIKD